MKSYKTIAQMSTWEQVIEKSRFIGIAYPVSNLEEVEEKLAEVRQLYPNARHYCYAYRLHQGKLEKSTDDGEPQGTGGKPIMDILQYRDIWDILLVVVRYFGGILLGTGGLTRAYGGTARQLMDEAPLVELVPHVVYEIEGGYEWYEPLKYWLKKFAWEIDNEEFMATVKFQVYIPNAEKEKFLNWFTDFTEQKIVPREIGIVMRGEKI